MRREEIYSLPPIAISYLNYLTAVKGRSELTVLEYASDLRMYFRFMKRYKGLCAKDTPFNEIDVSDLPEDVILKATLEDAYAFITFCSVEQHDGNTAKARKAVAVKRFYRYLEVNGRIEKNVIARLESPKTKKSLPKYLTLEQSVKLLNSVDGKNKERDYCILTLFLNCGLRLSELVGINISRITDENTLVVLGKGNKERTIYLNDACVQAISAYLAARPKDGVVDRDALFISSRKTRISRESVQKIVEASLKRAGLDGLGLSTHKLRHTAATLMYQYGGVDPLQLKEILGHENLSTTEIYTHVHNDQLRDAVDSNPLNKLADKGKKDK